MWWASDFSRPLADPVAPSDGGLLLITGCRPWPPKPGPGKVCGACGATVTERGGLAVCLWCHKASPKLAKTIGKPSGRRRADAGDVADEERREKAKLKAKYRGKLSERERRDLWTGVDSRREANFNVLVAAGRKWLRETKQEPDWSLILDRRGNVIGRVEPECEPAPAPESCSGCPTPACGSA